MLQKGKRIEETAAFLRVFLRAARWRARSLSWTAAATSLLHEVYYSTTVPAADFGPGPEAVAEGRAAIPGICFFASLAAIFGPGPAGAAERRPTRRGVCFSLSFRVARCFGPGPEARPDQCGLALSVSLSLSLSLSLPPSLPPPLSPSLFLFSSPSLYIYAYIAGGADGAT